MEILRGFFELLQDKNINNINAAARLITALLAGAIVGIERESQAKPAGMRTYMIISLGACLMTILSIYIPQTYSGPDGGDPGRIASGIVTGIGFLGAGAIMRFGFGIKGLTSAAAIWAVAAVGMAAGAGFYGLAFFAVVLILLSLKTFERLEEKLVGHAMPKAITIICSLSAGIHDEVEDILKANSIRIHDRKITEKIGEGILEYTFIAGLSGVVDVRKLINDFASIKGIKEVRLE